MVWGAGLCVICTGPLPAELLEPLGNAQVIVPKPGTGLMGRDEVLAAAPHADAIVNQAELRVDTELLDRAPRLQIVANVARGFDNLDLTAMAARGVWATNIPDAFTAPTAETALGLMLMSLRRLAEGERCVRAGEWSGFEPGRWDGFGLAGKTLGVVGFGKIGRAVAERARAFGMEIVYHRRTPCAPNADFAARWLPLDDLLQVADIVSLHIPATPETYRLIDARALARMKPNAVLINTARGSVVDEAALVAALRAGRIWGAGLDVAEDEPHVHPALRDLPNVVITPHLGGGTVESRVAARVEAIANVAAVLRWERPLSPLVDLVTTAGDWRP